MRNCAYFRFLCYTLIAGSNWNNEANSGSQSRNANNYRWNTNTNISSRASVDTECVGVEQLLAEYKNLVERQNTKKEDWSG